MISGMKNMPHEERPRKLALFSLEREDENNMAAAFQSTELAILHVHGGRQEVIDLVCNKKSLLHYLKKKKKKK